MALSKNQMVPHPDLNAIAAFIDRRLSEAGRTEIVTHLAGCAECRALIAAHARGQVAPDGQGQASAGPRSRSLFRPAVWLPIAATLALATTAALIVLRDRAPLAPAPTPSITPQPTQSPVEVTPPLPTPPPAATVPAPDPGSLTTRRGGVRQINGKTFRLVAGEWIDSGYDPLAALPVHEVTGPEARAALLAKLPILGQYAVLGSRVTVVHDGNVYQFRP